MTNSDKNVIQNSLKSHYLKINRFNKTKNIYQKKFDIGNIYYLSRSFKFFKYFHPSFLLKPYDYYFKKL